jgi:outer membrane lipoprotein-sorting protein
MIRGLGRSDGRRWAPVLLAMLAVASAAQAAAPKPAAPAPASPALTADEIVSRYIDARGGLKKIRSIQSLRQEGHATTGAGRQAHVTRELKRPGRVRFEFTVQGVTAVFASDGQHGWRVSPFEADMGPQPLPEEAVAEALEQGDIEGPLVDWKAKGHRVELVGHEAVGGHDTYKLKLTLKSGAMRYEYLDVKTLHQLRADTTRQVRGQAVQIQTTFDDYSKTNGILFPHLVVVQAVGRPQSLRVVVDTITVNPPLDDKRFAMPPTQP